MPSPTKTGSRQGPGIASQAEAARHWQVAPATAKKICQARGIKDTELRNRPTYRWADIWRIEGAANVDPVLWDAYRKPLLKPADLAKMFPDLSPRTIRRDLAAGRWPVIVLSDRVRLVRLSDVAEELEIRAGKRPVRRSRAIDPKLAAVP